MFSYSKDLITVRTILDIRIIQADGKFPVKVRVNFKRIRTYYKTGIALTKAEWENLSSNKSNATKTIRESIENSFSLVKRNVEALAERGDFSFDALNCRLGKASGDTVNNAFKAKINQLQTEERIGTMQLNQQTLNLLDKFAGQNISFDSITSQWLQKCESFWLKTKNQTTVGMHFRNLRAIMNDAKKAGFLKETQYPFGKDKFEIKTGEGHKKALSIKQISQIIDYSDGTETSSKYRDLWIFIYLCNGINVADLVKLKYSNIIDDEIFFIRQKTERTSRTRKEIRISLTTEIKSIIEQWGNPYKPDVYIFPYLKGKESAIERKTITKELTKRINMRMKLIGKEIGIDNISTYTARHSFATILKRGGANIAYISESLGHTDLRTTESYLASFDKEERMKNACLLTKFS